MSTRQECISKLTDAYPYIQSKYRVNSLCVFGSIARGDYHSKSDVDVCVDMPPNAFKVIGLKQYLSDLLDMDVDLVRRNPNLDKMLIKEIERDGIYIGS